MTILKTKLSSRQLRIIQLLLNHQNEITVASIAEQLSISSRTVHRELIVLEEYLDKFQIKLEKKAGIGIRIAGAPSQISQLKAVLKQKQPSTNEINTEERRTIILCYLLTAREPIKLFALAHNLNVTMPTIGYDLDELEPMILMHQLKLIRKRGYGVELIGQETSKRKLIASLVLDHLDSSQIINYAAAEQLSVSQPVIQHLIPLLGMDHYQTIEATIWSWQEANLIKLSEDSYSNLVLNLSIGLQRVNSGFTLPSQSNMYGKLSSQKQHAVAVEGQYLELTSRLLHTAKNKLPQEELNYINKLVEQVLSADQDINMYKEQQHIKTIIFELSNIISTQTNENLLLDSSLEEGLMKHMIPALKRIREGLAIRNPMLSNIKKEYAELFRNIQASVKALFPELPIPEEEIGYITMHYGAALERVKQLPKQLRAVIVCTAGIGSSKMLAVRLTKLFPQIRQIGHYSWYESARIPREKYDFIISTVDLPIESDQYIKLSPLVTDEEIEKLKHFIKHYVHQTQLEHSQVSKAPKAQRWFEELKHHSQAAIQLMETFETLQLTLEPEIQAMHELMPALINAVAHQNRIQDSDRVIEMLLAREKQGSIVLPQSQVALLHTRDEAITSPLLAIAHLNRAVFVNQNEHVEVKHIVLMLAPRKLDKYSLDILSEISSMLLDSRFISLIQMKQEEGIRAYVSTQLEEHIKEKLDWRE